ncbi:MAG: restriction endonuclease [Chitinophagaceae bacterium]|nr:MAG: restriction endonuclease [Chitinophagaceae bacterium]
MKKDRKELIQEYFTKVKAANKELTKREAFKDLLNRLYAGNEEIEKIIDAITLGAETNIANIPRKDKIHRGSADTLYNRIIIEYENDLRPSLNHAKEQLGGYMLGQFKSGEGYNYTLIASDFINWKIFAPDISSINQLETLQEHEVILNEVPTASFTLSNTNADDFYYWLDRFLFKEEKQKATLKRIEEAFGYQSNVFLESYMELSTWFEEAKKIGEVQVSFEQWKKFLSIAYGSFDASEGNFLIHTYLSVFSKMLAYTVVSNDDYIDEKELRGILEGSIFHRYNIRNFVDNDFFHWVKSDKNFHNLKKVFRLLAQEISTFDFLNVEEDVLKGVYQELIDLDTRHALGEYYTPDWLCERVLQEYDFKQSDKILDPSCGSGSFLRAAVHRLRELNKTITVEEISNQVYGIDIHPLSVQIAKTTMLITLGKEVTKAKRPIHINVILANTLLAPEGVKNLFGGEFRMKIDKQTLDLNTQVLEDVELFDEALELCEELAEQTLNQKVEQPATFEKILKNHYKQGGYNQQIVESFYSIYKGLKKVKEDGRDSIWKFIVQNLYKPYFLSQRFDYVIGNPPWFTFGSIKNLEYQNTLNALAEKYHVKPEKIANYPQLEIAAIFLTYCSSYFLKPEGKIAFVLPRSFFSADQHDNTRSGKSKGFKLTALWDLIKVSPLFNIPSAVLFGEKTTGSRKLPATGLPGLSFSGNLPAHNCNLQAAMPKLKEEEVSWFYVKQGKATAFSKTNTKASSKVNWYKKEFKNGATIYPRAFYFVELNQETPPDFEDRIINVKTTEVIQQDAKVPWKGMHFEGRIESRFLFRTALAKNILPFCLYQPMLITLPLIVNRDKYDKKIIQLHNASDLRKEGYLSASKWFHQAEELWNENRTDRNQNTSVNDCLNWQSKLEKQDLNQRFLVLYNSSAKDANATVVDRNEIDFEFIVENTTYVYFTSIREEAFYLTAILNSTAPNELMKDFQARGLFGARHVHKKILDIFYPKYNSKTSVHLQLAQLSEQAHKKANTFVSDNTSNKVAASILGRLRLLIKKHLKEELEQIDELVKALIS